MALISKKIVIVLLIIFVAGLVYLYFQRSSRQESLPFAKRGVSQTLNIAKSGKNMKIESPAFSNNQFIPSKYTCEGDNVNPPLRFSEIPQTAKSLVLIVDDPDAPSGTWVHWTVWNISPNTQEITENSVPEGAVEGLTDFGKPGYGGPCPPSGVHRYFFKLFALDTVLQLENSAKVSELKKAMEGHIIAEAELVGLYER
jgi:hypothetical protein